MSPFKTQINTNSENFLRNSQVMQGIVNDLKEKLAHITEGGNATARARHHEHGKLLPRERIQLLLDPGSDF